MSKACSATNFLSREIFFFQLFETFHRLHLGSVILLFPSVIGRLAYFELTAHFAEFLSSSKFFASGAKLFERSVLGYVFFFS